MSADGEPRSLWQAVDEETPVWALLEFRDVFKIYRSGPVETVALRGLDLSAERGELIAVVGPSGCGKSTLLALAAGLDLPSAGDVRVEGRPLAHLSETELADHRGRTVAMVFQSDNLWPALSAFENVVLGLRLAHHSDSETTASEALARFGLAKRARHRAGELSGGEQQRVAIAAAYAREAPLVLADEPTGELDVTSEAAVLAALRQLTDERGSCVIVATHSDRVADIADRVVRIRDGRVLA